MIVWQREKTEAETILCSIRHQPLRARLAGNRTHQQVKNKIGPIDFKWWPAIFNSDRQLSDSPFFSPKSEENILNRLLAAAPGAGFPACFKIPGEKDPYFLTGINVY